MSIPFFLSLSPSYTYTHARRAFETCSICYLLNSFCIFIFLGWEYSVCLQIYVSFFLLSFFLFLVDLLKCFTCKTDRIDKKKHSHTHKLNAGIVLLCVVFSSPHFFQSLVLLMMIMIFSLSFSTSFTICCCLHFAVEEKNDEIHFTTGRNYASVFFFLLHSFSFSLLRLVKLVALLTC